MAKRGSRSRFLGVKHKLGRRSYSRPALEWAVGDDNLDMLAWETPDQFALSLDDKDARGSVFKVEERNEANKEHKLIPDAKAASRYGYSVRGQEKSNPPAIEQAGSVPSKSVQPASHQSTSEQSTSEQSTSDQSTSGQPALGQPKSNPTDADVSIYAPDAKAQNSGFDPELRSSLGPGVASEDVPVVALRATERANGTYTGAYTGTEQNTIEVESASTILNQEVDPKDLAYNAFRQEPKHKTALSFEHEVAHGVEHKDTGEQGDEQGDKQGDEQVGGRNQGILAPYAGSGGAKRVESVRLQLDRALEAWWGDSTLPSTALLRDGLLVLEAGHSLDEVHRTLLLRSSLAKRRGLLTALRHQTDPDRAAFLIKDALLDAQHPLTVADVSYLLAENDANEDWAALLLDELRYDLPQMGADKKDAAQTAIQLLEKHVTDFHPPILYRDPIYDVAVNGMQPHMSSEPVLPPVRLAFPRLAYWNVGRIVLALLLIASLWTTWRWLQGRTTLADMVMVPAGVYVVGHSGNGIAERNVNVIGYAIDRTEVTNASYLLCYEQGVCPMPVETGSATRQAYFLNPAFGTYPVVYVEWINASKYCSWAGKRLPTEDEWEIAASSAPATNRHFRYPWGDRFNRLYANSAESNIGDTQQSGIYYPIGTSSIGAEAMAGNVAEWTSTIRSNGTDDSYVVKGGSYMDPPEKLWSSFSTTQPANFSAPWLGFRCARTVEPEQ